MYSTTSPECFVFNDGNKSNDLLAASMMNGGGFGGGYNSPFWAIILLGLLRNGFLGNDGGYGGGNHCCTTQQLQSIQETLNTQAGQTAVLSAITGVNGGVDKLASTLNCDINAVQTAINAIQSAICNLGSKNDMSAMQIVNAITSGNSALANQLAQCCCDNKLLTTQQGYENRINNMQQSQLIQNGFAQVGYASAEQTCAIKQNATDNTSRILAKLDAMEDSRKDREINALTAELATVKARAERQAELAPITQKLSDIMCKQPNTVTVPYQPFVTVPSCVAWNAGLYGSYPYANGGNFG